MRTAVMLLIILLIIYVLFSGRGLKVWKAITE